MLDPGNPRQVREGTHYQNSVLVPGNASALYDPGAAPHGTLAAVWYPSSTLKTQRRMLVYTPPGYETSSERYPVLYLLHGGGGDEDTWDLMGAANVIMDNLIAQRKAVPMIVVMPNANWDQTAAFAVGGSGAAPLVGTKNAGPPPQDYRRAQREIIDDMAPFVEKNFRVLTDREHRAIAGLSMGAGIALNVGLNRLDKFASVGEFSSGMFGGVAVPPFDMEKSFPGLLKDPSGTNQKLKVLYMSCGTEDSRLPFQKQVAESLRNHQIKLTFESYPGTHEWRPWRNSLASFAPRLFR
jgi:enterochelin esterase family protein